MWTDPASHIFVTGELVTAANFKTYVTDDLSALRAGLTAAAFKTAQPNIAHNAWTAVSWEANSWDNANLHNVAGALDRFTAPVAGVYRMHVEQLFRNTVPGGPPLQTDEGTRIMLNGTTVLSEGLTHVPDFDWPFQISREWKCAAGDYLGAQVWQASGNPLPLLACTASCSFVGTGA